MANYRLFRKGDDDYEIVGIWTSGKGGAKKLVVRRATYEGLQAAAEEVAEEIAAFRPPPGPGRDVPGKPNTEEAK